MSNCVQILLCQHSKRKQNCLNQDQKSYDEKQSEAIIWNLYIQTKLSFQNKCYSLIARCGLDICSASFHGLGHAGQNKQLQQFGLPLKYILQCTDHWCFSKDATPQGRKVETCQQFLQCFWRINLMVYGHNICTFFMSWAKVVMIPPTRNSQIIPDFMDTHITYFHLKNNCVANVKAYL